MGRLVTVKPQLGDPCMEVMNFLNQACEMYPSAISFAAGRPPQSLVSARASAEWLARYVEYRAEERGQTSEAVWQMLGQYGSTNGEICDLLARAISLDEGLDARPSSLMVTNGMQEAVLVLLLGIFERGQDVLLCDDPAYIGILGAAHVAGVPVVHLAGSASIAERTRTSLQRLEAQRLTGRALYVVPDFSNPTGRTLTLQERLDLLEVAERHDLLILEDVAYRAFRYDGETLPSLKALDRSGVVIQIGTFSKLFMPGPRLGYLYADQLVRSDQGHSLSLAEELSKVKSFTSVLTSPLAQATVGGFLIEHNFSLREWNRTRIAHCRARRDLMLECLSSSWRECEDVRWTRPEGGFFIVLETGFEFGRSELMACADKFGVVVCPLSLFSSDPAYAQHVRLAFSNVSAENVGLGVERLAAFVSSMRSRSEAPSRSLVG